MLDYAIIQLSSKYLDILICSIFVNALLIPEHGLNKHQTHLQINKMQLYINI